MSYLEPITKAWAAAFSPCSDGPDWFDSRQLTSATMAEVYEAAAEDDRLEYANWALCRYLTPDDRRRYVLHAAETVLHLYEAEYPESGQARRYIALARAQAPVLPELRLSAVPRVHHSIPALYAAYAAYRAADSPKVAEEGVMDAVKACGRAARREMLEDFCAYGLLLVAGEAEDVAYPCPVDCPAASSAFVLEITNGELQGVYVLRKQPESCRWSADDGAWVLACRESTWEIAHVGGASWRAENYASADLPYAFWAPAPGQVSGSVVLT